MKPVETDRMLLSAKDLLVAALEGSTVTYSRVEADAESPKTHNTVIEFHETPDELAEELKDNVEFLNRMGLTLEE